MKILFTGKPNKGSWQIRAVQMAEGFAQCIPLATVEQCRKFDFIVAIKRLPGEVLSAIRASGKPWAWDVVDAYPQPQCAAWSKAQAIAWMQERMGAMRPTTAVFATHRMKDDVAMGGDVIPHHHRPSIACNPIRDQIKTIGYEGSPRYLAHWDLALRKAAVGIGATFVDRATSLAECDVVVAVRGGDADCYATRNWKSNVKLANAHASGTPFIGQPDAGYRETATGAECWVETPKDLPAALAHLAAQRDRARIAHTFKRAAISVDACRKQWTDIAQRHV